MTPTLVSVLLPCLLLHALAPAAVARQVSVLKYNAGGYAIAGFETDPTATVTGPNLFYRGPSLEDLDVGRSHRWAADDGFTYQIPVGPRAKKADGTEGEVQNLLHTFDISLIFAEIYPPNAAVGKRQFNITIEDTQVEHNLDVYKAAGNKANVQVTRTFKNVKVSDGRVSLAFTKGSAENPMVSGMIIKSSNGSKFEVNEFIDVEGTGKKQDAVKNKGFDHQAHAIAGGPYTETDYNGDGSAEVVLDGSGSHSHYFDANSGETGKIVRYLWTWKPPGKDMVVLGRKKVIKAVFPVGTHTIRLEVEDQLKDVADAQTKITIKPGTSAGAYCYYYDTSGKLPKSLNSVPKPVEGYSSNLIDFSEDEFQYSKRSGLSETNKWAMRCVADFYSKTTRTYQFAVKFRGKGAQLWVNDGLKAQSMKESGNLQTISAKVMVPASPVSIQIIYYAGSNNPSLSLLSDGKVAPPNVLSYKAAEVIPTISSISTDSVKPGGGGSLTIIGTGYFDKLTVNIGASKAFIGAKGNAPSILKISGNELILRNIPSADKAKAAGAAGGKRTAVVTVSNAFGTSNQKVLQYTSVAKEGIRWQQTFFKDKSGNRLSLKQITGVKLGPDQHYYMSSLSGKVYRLKVGKNLQVQTICNNNSVKRPVLGLAFDYGAKALSLYVTTSSLYWFFGGAFKNQRDGWANGAVERFTGGCGCLCYDRKIVTGLPVSNHDHGVNGIVIKDGSMYISNGGSTNAGHNTPGNKLGGWPESPLSAAVLVANFRKGGFNGKVRYNQYNDPESAKVTGGDVKVFASGLRNSYGIAMRLNGQIWATDNGGNPGGYGDHATGCGKNDFKPYTGKDPDKIIWVKSGDFHGHPNRARGECSKNGAKKANKLVVSATTGIVEYTANTFGTQLLRHLVFTKYAAEGSGVTSQSFVKPNGDISPQQMMAYSGVAVEVGLHGELVMPRVQQGFIAVLKPDKSHSGTAPFVIAASPPRGVAGKKVLITGFKFKGGAVAVKIGGKAAGNVKVLNDNEIECTVPGGSGVVGVSVTVGGVSSAGNGAPPFRYEG